MWIALYLRECYSTPVSLTERKNYSIGLCERGEYVCHQGSTSELRVRLAPLNRLKPSSKIFY